MVVVLVTLVGGDGGDGGDGGKRSKCSRIYQPVDHLVGGTPCCETQA